MSLLRRRTMLKQQEDEEVKEWQTIADMVTETELSGSGNTFIFTAMPDGTPIKGKKFREIAVYCKYNANSDGATSGYIKTIIRGVNGATTAAQTTAGVPSTGYRRVYMHVTLGNLFNLFNVQQSINTSMQEAGFYDVTAFIDEIERIQILTYANVGVGSEIKIMGR